MLSRKAALYASFFCSLAGAAAAPLLRIDGERPINLDAIAVREARGGIDALAENTDRLARHPARLERVAHARARGKLDSDDIDPPALGAHHLNAHGAHRRG